MMTHGATIDFQIIYALFTRTIFACDKLNVDKDLVVELKDVLEKLPPMKVSERYGNIQEWIKDYEETEPGHRHISQLFGLFPADQINETDPEIYEAAKKTIARRIENGGGSTGWSRAWTVCFYTRLKDGENTMKHLHYLVNECTAYNLFDIHPPFQIDGNFGGVAGITEMFIQSHLGSPDNRIVELLPALPDQWGDGSIKGVKARGNFTFDLDWANGKLTKAVAHSANKGVLQLKLNDRTSSLKANKNAVIENGILKIELNENECVEFTA